MSIAAEGSCHRFITRSPLQSSLHHRVREKEQTAVSKANRAEERAAEGRKRGTETEEEVEETQVCWWRNTGSQSTGALSLRLSSITLPLFFIPVTFFMAPWLLDPGVCCHFSAVPCSRPPPPPPLEAGVSSAELEPHTAVVRQCRPRDGLNATVELLTFGPEMTGKNPFTHGYFILPPTHPKATTKQPNVALSA